MRSGDLNAQRSRFVGRGFVVVVLFTVIGFSLICGRTLLDMRRADWETARQTSANIASTLNADIQRNIELYDLSLRAVVSNVILPELQSVSKSLRHLVLFDRAATARYFGPIKIYGPTGNVLDDSTILKAWTENSANADYFKVHQENGSPDLFISDPFQDSRGEYAIYLSRRISNADGSFAGVVAGSIKVSYFHDLFRRLNMKSEDSFSLINRRGIVAMRIPFEVDYIGKDLSRSWGVSQALKENSGWYERVSDFDHINRLYVWESGTSPLFVIAGQSYNQIYANWLVEAKAIIAAMVVLISIMVAVTMFLLREMKQRSLLESRLAEFALTDGLTGLVNRRHFDHVLEKEWDRALRDRKVLSVMMIDADNFKNFNDRFGHPAGDQLLVRLASCISNTVRRAGDCAARYGGEEFSVILPGTNAKQAKEIAERIRFAVANMSLEGCSASVSIGVASLLPTMQGAATDIILAADQALYQAKAKGKNCTLVYGDALLRVVS